MRVGPGAHQLPVGSLVQVGLVQVVHQLPVGSLVQGLVQGLVLVQVGLVQVVEQLPVGCSRVGPTH